MDRVLEIGGYAAGYCGRLFAHNGYDVVRADVALAGEAGPQPPAWARQEAMEVFLHSRKRRVSVTDVSMLERLADAADVVVCEAATADALSALGFEGWSTAVKVAITPFGRTGPKRNWRATPNVLLAMGGYTQLMGDPERAPLNLPGHYLEFQTGTLAYAAANACRFAGQANVIDLGMFETLMTLSQFTTVRWHCAGELRSRHGSDFWYVVPSNLFACADGWVYLNIVPSFWDPLTVFLEKPELLLDERFLDNDLRMQHRDELHEIIAGVLAPLTAAAITARAEQCRVPLGVVQNFDEVLADPHLAARGFFVAERDEQGQSWLSPALPFSLHAQARHAS